MQKKINIKLTLEDTETSEEYDDLRDEMVKDLVDIRLDNPTAEMLIRYKEMLNEEIRNMSDEELQALHSEHIEYFITKVPIGSKEEDSWQSSINSEPIL